MPQSSLEQEAMDRVRRMYASFDRRQQASNEPAPQPPREKPPREKPPNPQAAEHAAPQPAQAESEQAAPEPPKKANSLLDIFLKDRDQSLILLLLVLLMKDGADMNLLLALVYLLIE
ncbi:hypothetical protein [Ruminococcus sp.]|uniref:hypothetical protein n=1 Tax=Ruminococcus sp. TaxID=41978 RepID=UPI0038906A33